MHCQITYHAQDLFYSLKDVSSPSSSGTWITVPSHVMHEEQWLNLHQDRNYKRDYKIVQGDTEVALRFSLNTEKQTIDSLEHWCA